ncbi:MAG: glycosyltransferase family 1 protein [Gemmataceae bacterium]|nr:glycosyltransferase family 1 protein [Gemmataceae bacterium]
MEPRGQVALEAKSRLLLITETFPPEVNGVSLTLGHLANGISDFGWELEVLRPRQQSEPSAPCLTLGLPIPFYPTLRFGIASPFRLLKRIRKVNPDLIHVATEGPLGLIGLFAARYLNIPILSSFHTNFDLYAEHYQIGFLKWLVSHYLKWFHNRTALTLAPSFHTIGRLEQMGIRDVKLWSRGVDTQLFHPKKRDEALRKSLDLGEEDVLVLYVGRLAQEKNLQSLIRAFEKTIASQKPGQTVKLALVGDGPEKESLEALINPQILLTGQQKGEDLARWYASSDIFAFPSLSETFGNVVQEAQASGLPVVAFQSPVMGERIENDKNGFLAQSPDEFQEKLQHLAYNPGDRVRLGQAAWKSVQEQSWINNISQLNQTYRIVLASHQKVKS